MKEKVSFIFFEANILLLIYLMIAEVMGNKCLRQAQWKTQIKKIKAPSGISLQAGEKSEKKFTPKAEALTVHTLDTTAK